MCQVAVDEMAVATTMILFEMAAVVTVGPAAVPAAALAAEEDFVELAVAHFGLAAAVVVVAVVHTFCSTDY